MVQVIRQDNPIIVKPHYEDEAFESPRLPDTSAKTGNDENEGNAQDAGRDDKDQDLKSGTSKDAASEQPERSKITPHSLSSPDYNHGHSVHPMAENEQLDPSTRDVPDLNATYPGEKELHEDK